MAVGAYTMGDPRRQGRRLVLAGDAAPRIGVVDGRRRCSSACHRFDSAPTTSRSPRSRSRRSSATSPTTGATSPAATWDSSATPAPGASSRSASTAGWTPTASRHELPAPAPAREPGAAFWCSRCSSRSSCGRRGGASSRRSARTRTRRAPSARTRSRTSSSRSRSRRRSPRSPASCSRSTLILSYPRVRPGLHDLRLRDRDPRRARELPRRDPRLGLPDLMLEGTRYLELPLSDARVAAIRFIIVGPS